MPERYCIFCGNLADSREHLLPDWLTNVLPSQEPIVHFREVGGTKSSWEKKGFSEKTRCVCEVCNHGWMSRLESAAKPILIPPITRSGIPYELDLRAQWIAANWAAKTCFVSQTLAPALLAPMTHPALLHINGKPPPQVSVFIGSHVRALQDPGNCAYLQKPLALKPQDEHLEAPPDFGYLCFLAVGGVSFLLVGHRLGNYVEVTLGEHTRDLFTKIWPWSQKLVPWPPKSLMDSELVVPLFGDSVPSGLEARVFSVPVHQQPPFSANP